MRRLSAPERMREASRVDERRTVDRSWAIRVWFALPNGLIVEKDFEREVSPAHSGASAIATSIGRSRPASATIMTGSRQRG